MEVSEQAACEDLRTSGECWALGHYVLDGGVASHPQRMSSCVEVSSYLKNNFESKWEEVQWAVKVVKSFCQEEETTK